MIMEAITTNVLALFIASVIVESVAFVIADLSLIKAIDAKITQVSFKVWIAIFLGIAICITAKIDVLAIFLGTERGWLGIILSGLLVSRGSNYIHDIVKKMKSSGTPTS